MKGMKKNLINGLLVLAVASVGAGTFSSCKDNNGDELSVTQARVDALEIEILELRKCKQYCEEAREALKKELMILIGQLQDKDKEQDARIGKLEQDIINIYASITTLDQRITELEEFKTKFEVLDPQAILEFMEAHSLATNEVINNILNDIDYIKNNYVTKEEFNTTINNIKNEINTKYNELSEKAENGVKAWAWIEANKARLDALEKADEEMKAKHEADIINLQNQITEIENKVTQNTSLIEILQGDVKDLQANFESLQDRVAANEAAIKELRNDVNNLFGLVDRLNKMVTGIINQATTNPVFGTFNLPINVRSNMLITYFGSAETSYTFPSHSSAAEYNGDLVFSDKDMQMLQGSGNFKSLAVAPGDVLMDTEDGNAGMVFLTINPNNVDFTGMNLPLVNSQDVESGMKLKNLKKSDKVLDFGYTRAANNGFYEAQATLAPENVNDVAVNIEPGLKSAFKDVLENRGKKDFAQLAKLLYNQFSGILPANGLKAAWTAPDGQGNIKEYAVYSNYDLAATAVSPLSFKFMEGQSINHKLPIITPISGFEFDKDQFKFDIKLPDFSIKDPNFDIKLSEIDITPEGELEITITIPKYDAEGNQIGTEDVKYAITDDTNNLLKYLEQQFNGTIIPQWNKDIEDAFRKAFNDLRDDVYAQVDKVLEDVMGQVNENLGNIIDEINKEVDDALGGYINNVNKVIDKYNKVADKLNKFLDNPNHMLQSMMCYKGTDGDFHQMSNSKDMPSEFRLAGGNAISLYLTSYNAEIIAPSFKKFVGITNVWNNETGASAQDGDAACLELLNKANNLQYMNQPITGKQHRVAFSADKAGYTYEIVYSALDYRGWTSSRKYYVTIK